MKKRTVAVLIALVLLVSVIPQSAFASTTPTNWAVAEMSDANVKGLLTANAAKDFQRQMTRIEFCEIVVRMVEQTLGRELELPAANKFTDTNSEDVQKANRYGIVNGRTETTFDPNAPVSREEIAAMMNRAMRGIEISLGRSLRSTPVATLTFNDTSSIMGYAVEDVKYAVASGIFKGDNYNNFNPQNNITSEECVAVVVRSYNSMEDKINPTLSQLQLIEKTLDRLHIGYAYGDIPEAVSQNITLPTVGAGGVAITWTTSNASAISATGVVNPTGASATLTATVSLGGTYRTKAYELTTTTLSGSQKLISNAKTALEIGFYNENDSLDSVTGRIFLPTTALGLDVTWYSDRPSTVTTGGLVIVPNDSSVITVNLTASFNYGGVSGTKVFTLLVRNPQYAANAVSLHNIKLGMSLSEVSSALNGSSYVNAYTLISGETWYIYHSDSSYNNFIAVAFRSSKVVGVYTMVNGWESYLRDANNANRNITVAEANTAPNVAVQTFTDSGNSNKAYAAFMYDTTSAIASERILIASATESFIAELVNAYRYLYGNGSGKTVLAVDTLLSNSARSHSTEMDNNNYFSITGLSNSTFQTRASAAGSSATVLGGVIAYNSINPFDFLDSAIKNSTYRSYILSAGAGQIGVGYSGSYTGSHKNLLTMVFSSSTAISSVTANPSAVSAIVGSTTDVNLTFLPTTFTESFTVTSSNTAIFTVSHTAKPSTNVYTYSIKGVAVGTAYLYVYNSSNTLLRTITVTVTTGTYATAISVSPALVEAGKTFTMTAATTPVSGPVVTWTLQTPYSSSSTTGTYQRSVSSINASTGVLSTTSVTGTATVRASALSSATTSRTADATVYVTSVTLPVSSVTLASAGKTQSIAPTISCGGMAGFTTTYTSSNTNVATVNNTSGMITAVNAGTATITVTVSRAGCTGTIVKTVVVTVTTGTYASAISVSPALVEAGKTFTMSAVTTPSSGPVVTWTLQTPYSSSITSGTYQKSVSSINASTGTLSTTSVTGTATVRASTPSGTTTTRTADATVYVTSVMLPMTSVTLAAVGSTQSIAPTISCGGMAGFTTTYTSSNTNVATVLDGVVTAVNAGTATITVTVSRAGCVGTIVKTVVVTVQNSQYPLTATASPATLSILKGTSGTILINTVPATVTNKIVTTDYAGSDLTVSVNSSGNIVVFGNAVTAASTFKVFVQKSSDPNDVYIITVTVTVELVTPTISFISPPSQMTVGDNITLYATVSNAVPINWSITSGGENAIIDNTGKITALNPGTVEVTASVDGVDGMSNPAAAKITIVINPTP